VKGAAEVLGISPLTVRDLIADARIRVGVETNEQLVLVLARRGRLSVPRARSAGVTRAV
jgi:DNA-binding CsgD family transcriptional regulator